MTAPTTWTVYTVEPVADAIDTYNVIGTRWTAEGPQTDSAQVAKTLTGVTADEAQKRAEAMQRGYDRLRRGMAPNQ